MRYWKKLLCLLTAALFLLFGTACTDAQVQTALDLADIFLSEEDTSSPEAKPHDLETLPQEGETDDGPLVEEVEDPININDFDGDVGTENGTEPLDEDGVYFFKDDVALYIHLYGHLPDNYITKQEARELGWEGGSLEDFAPGKCIGGSHFGNYEGLLPEDHDYRECDIDTLGASSRGAKRIIYSDDGLIYYTEDHYESFTLLYGEE